MKKICSWLIVGVACAMVLLITISIWPSAKNGYNDNNQDNKSKETISINEFNLANRIIVRNDNAITVGNNVKELVNDFYDIKIENASDGIIIYLNKLWYESYGADYIQDEYLAQICREIGNRLSIYEADKELEYTLYKYIKDNYMKARQGASVDKMITNNFVFEMELEDSMVKLVIRGR